jgi:TolA-binding protein
VKSLSVVQIAPASDRAVSITIAKFFFVISVPFFCTGCVNNQKNPVLIRVESELSAVRKIQAEQTSQISSMQADLRALSGRIEELEFSQQRRLGTTLDTLQQSMNDLQRRVPPPAIVPASILEIDEGEVLGLDGENLRLFHEALSLVRLGKFQESIPMLQSLADAGYDQPWAVYPLFWLGVAFDGTSETRRALSAYSDISGRFSKHDRAPVALLRQASAFIRLGDSKAARLSLQKLIAEFPKTPEAAQGRERLKGLR